MDSKQLLIEILDYYKYKLTNNLCTMEEIESASRALEENMEVNGTISDFADFYNQSKDAVNGVIKRNLVEKPKRNVVLYPFHKFMRVIPNSWRGKH